MRGLEKKLNILFVHEVDYFRKVIFEFQIIPEIFSLLGHNVFVIDYPQGEAARTYKKDYILDAFIFENVHRVYNNASITVVRPCISRLPFWGRIFYFLKIGRLIEKIIRDKQIDLVFLFAAPNSGWQTIKMAHKYRVPVVFRLIDVAHQIVPNKIYKYPTLWFEKYVYRNSDLILTLTPKLKDYAVSLGADSRRILVQLGGVDLKRFKPAVKNLNLAKKWEIDGGDKVVLFMGTLYDFSNLDWLAKNWDQVKKVVPNAKLLIVGNGPLFSKIKNIIKEKNMEDAVIMTDWQPYDLLPDFINISDICINLFEINEITRYIIPTKLFQYQACARPIVSIPLPGMLDILKGEQDGVVYVKNKKDAISNIINLLLNEDNLHIIGKNGLELMREKYGWRKIAESIMSAVSPLIQ